MLFWITFLLVIPYSLQHSLHVTPQRTNQSVPGNCSHSECMLSELLENAHHYFVSNTKISFHSGIHQINKPIGDILIQNIENISFHGAATHVEPGTTIQCNDIFSLTFVNVTNLSILNIALVGCSSEFSYESIQAIYALASLCDTGPYLSLSPCKTRAKLVIDHGTITVASGENVSIHKLQIVNSKDVALLLLNVHNSITMNQLTLEDNSINCVIATVEPFTDYPQIATYRITNSSFKRGNTTKAIASGLNILNREMYEHLIFCNISNVIVENNLGALGSIVLQIQTHLRFYSSICHSRIVIKFHNVTVSHSASGICSNGLTITNIIPQQILITADIEPVTCAFLVFEDVRFANTKLFISLIKSTAMETMVKFSNILIYGQKCFSWTSFMLFHNARVFLSSVIVHSINGIGFFQCNVTIDGINKFNKLVGHGFILQESYMTFKGETIISNNQKTMLVMYTQSSKIVFEGTTIFSNNTPYKFSCLTGNFHSVIIIEGRVIFSGNKAYNGGAIALLSGSTLILQSEQTSLPVLQMTNNYASNYGGAIYVEDYSITKKVAGEYKQIIPCAIFVKLNRGVSYIFNNNTARLAGHKLFGGWFDYCFNIYNEEYYEEFTPITGISVTNQTEVSSSALRICICRNNQINCKIDHWVEVFPGEQLSMNVVAVGQLYGIVPATVRAQPQNSLKINELELLQNVQQTCTKLVYTIQLSKLGDEDIIIQDNSMILLVHGRHFTPYNGIEHSADTLAQDLFITISIKPCTKGYNFNALSGVCECDKTITNSGLRCDLQSGTIERRRAIWIHPTTLHLRNEQLGQSNSGVIVHKFCPLDYCIDTDSYIDLNQPDEQCQHNRSGVLCGRCSQNTSAVFGSTRCLQCSSYWAFLIIPLTLLAGLFIVALLRYINLTVSQGTINGIIFYANVVQANQHMFDSRSNSFLKWFIAWLNFDLGFEVCFYNGMDTYAKTWLQLVFPLYVWFLVILMITCSRYSTKVSKLSGYNAVQVLATLFLFSYTKLLRIIISSLASTTIEYPNGHIRRVWLYDGNIEYRKEEHLALFMLALLILIFLSLPYTMLLFSIQWLQRFTHRRGLRWVTRLLPIFDAYTGPYKIKHRYWTGLLLLVRIFLFLVFSLNVAGDPTINHLATIITILCLLIYSAHVGGVYRNWVLNLLENIFHLNLGIVSSATLYVYTTGGDQSLLVHVSTGISLAVFILIISYHIFLKISNCPAYVKVKLLFKAQISRKRSNTRDRCEPREEVKRNLPTRSVVELSESLL